MSDARLPVGYEYSKDLVFATQGELDAVQSIATLVQGYIGVAVPPRPLCLAVFGAPGSGKSRTVKAVVRTLGLGKPRTINLTQLTSFDQLGERLEAALADEDKPRVPVVFFDEFDAPKDGAPLGWLPWFLAPMQDGERFWGGAWRPIGPAIFVFAGGTAHRAADFGADDPTAFRAAKGPDFVSRLRGFLDVLGPNDGNAIEREWRRKRAIEYQLKVELAPGGAAINDTPELRQALYDIGRFRHGDRSIGAVLELCTKVRATRPEEERANPLGIEHLPKDHILALHVDAGPLDPARIGGAVGMSCNFADRSSGEAMKDLARDLWRQGARLAYFRADAGTDAFVWEPTAEARAQPAFLSRTRYGILRVATFVIGEVDVNPGGNDAVEVVHVPGLGTSRWRDQPDRGMAELFRLRWIMNSRCVARVLVQGKEDLSPGRRTQGILEEAMLALATGQPIYVLGAFGGAARYLGGLLGLATGPVPDSLPQGNSELPEHAARLGGAIDLPSRGEQIPDFLTSFALGGSRWPDNGLSVDENRALFESSSAEDIARMVRTGLLRRLGT